MAEKIDLSTVRILMVGSNRTFLDMIRDVLAMVGANKVLCATDVAKAKRHLCEDDVDFVITEWNLEGQTGVDLLADIRNSPESPNRLLPVIILTADSDENFALTARDRGVTEFLPNSFTAQALYDRIVAEIARLRPFVDIETYCGPDRRRRQVDFGGPDRRQAAL